MSAATAGSSTRRLRFPDSTTLLVLSDVERGPSSRRSRLLLPFDRPLRVARVPAVRAVGRRQWAHRFRTHLSTLRAAGALHAAQHAAIDLLPFQLEPALALIGGHASRFLLADEVGLGKTIQAGLMLAELQQRGWCAHAIIAVPSGIRRQWADELRERFGIRARVIDAAAIAALGRFPASRCQSLVGGTGCHHVNRFSEAAGGASRHR